MWSRGVRGAGGGWWILLLSCLLALCSEAAVRRKHQTAYIVDPVGNPLPKPAQVPPKVGSPGSLVQPDRYEFYTFDESGELIKRLMTLREIQEIIATGDGEDGHVLTVAQTDLSKPVVTFNLQPPSHTKVHSIVSNVKNVLKAEMEAQKINPPKENMFDTPDVSSSWSMILPAIFGNTGGSIAPDSLISMHSAPETDVITVIKDVPKPETQTVKIADDSESQRPKPESVTQSLLDQISDDTDDDIENDDNTYSEVEDLIEEELTKFASKATESVLFDEVSSTTPVTESGTKLEKITTASQPTTEKIVHTTEPTVASTTHVPITTTKKPVATDVENTVSESTTIRLTTQTEKETEKPITKTTTKDVDQTTVKTVFTKIPLIQKVNNTDNLIKIENSEKVTIIPTKSSIAQTTTDNINKIISTESVTTEKLIEISTTITQKPSIINKDSTAERTTTEKANEELFVSNKPIKQQEIIIEDQTISTQTPSLQFSTRVTQTEPTRVTQTESTRVTQTEPTKGTQTEPTRRTQTEPTRETITQGTTIQTQSTNGKPITPTRKTTLSQEITDSTTFKTTTKTNFEIERTTEKENLKQNEPIFTKPTEIKPKPIQNNLHNDVLQVAGNEDEKVEDLAVTTYKPNVRPSITNTAQPSDKIIPVSLIQKPVNKISQNSKKPIITSLEDESFQQIQVPQSNQQPENQKDVLKIQDTTKNIVSTTPKNTFSDIKIPTTSSGEIKPIPDLYKQNKTSTTNNKKPIKTNDAIKQQSTNEDKNDRITNEDNKKIVTSTTPKNTFVKISSSNSQEVQDSTTSVKPIDQIFSSTTEFTSTQSPILTTTVKEQTTFSEITTKKTTEENLQLDVYQLINKISNDLVNEKNSGDEITTILNKLLATTSTRPNTVSPIQETSYNTKPTSIVNTQPSETTLTTKGDVSNQEDNFRTSTTNENKILEEKTTSIPQNPTTERVSLPIKQFSYNLSESISDVLSQFNDGFKTTIVPTTYTSSTDKNSNSEEENSSSEKETDFVKTTISTLKDTISTTSTTTENTKVEELTTKQNIQTTTSTQSSDSKTSQSPITTPRTTVTTTNKPITDIPTTNNPTTRISVTPSNNVKNNKTSNIIQVNIKNNKDNLTRDFITPIYKRTESTTKHNTPITSTTVEPTTEKLSTTKVSTIKTTASIVENTEKPADDDDELMEMLNKYTEMLKISENTFMKTPTKSESPPKPWKLIKNTEGTSNLKNESNIDKLNINIDGIIENLKSNRTESLETSTQIVENPNDQNEKITYTHAELPIEKVQNHTTNKLIPRKEISTNGIQIKNIGHLAPNKPVQKIPVVNSRISLDEMENVKDEVVNSTSKYETSSHKNKVSTSSSTPSVKIEESTTTSQSIQNKIEKQREKITQDLINISLIKDTKNSSNSGNEWKLVPTVHPKNETNNESNFKPGVEQSSIEPQVHQRPPQIQNNNQPIKNYQSQQIGQIHLPGINGGEGLQRTTAGLSEDVFQFSKLCNELAFRYWDAVSSNGLDPKRSLVVSPFAVTSLLAMVFLGARGATSGEMNDILRLDDMVTFNPHIVFKNVTESIEVSKKSGVATSAFIRELYSDRAKGRLLSFYKDRVQQFYSGHVEEANFKIIGDIIRRRTNLLVKRHTWSKIPEYIKANNMILRPPLSIFSANVFQTDCSIASTEGRDGEMYFVVSPTIRQRRLIPVPAVVYKSGFLAGYVPELDATVVAIDKGDQIVSTIFVMPGQQGSTAQGDDIQDLQKRLMNSAIKDDTWTTLLKSLTPRQGLELQIPRLSHRSIINGTAALQKMGLKDLFDSEKADLRGLNGQANDLYLTDFMLVNTFSTCGEGYIGDQHHVEVYPGEPNKVQRRLWRIPHRPIIQEADGTHTAGEYWEEPRDYQRAFHDPLHDTSYLLMPLHLRPRQARLPDLTPEPPRLKFDRPFMFFVRHNPTGLILHMGRYNPRLLP